MSQRIETVEKISGLKQICEEFAESKGIQLNYFNPLSRKNDSEKSEVLKEAYLCRAVITPEEEGMEGANKNISLAYLGRYLDDNFNKSEIMVVEDRRHRVIVDNATVRVWAKEIEKALMAMRKVSDWGASYDKSPQLKYFFGGLYGHYEGAKVFLDNLFNK